MSFSLLKTVVPAACALALLPTLAHAQQTVTVGTTDSNSSNAYPFGYNFGSNSYVAGSEYQELYPSTAFASVGSPFTIKDIAFAAASATSSQSAPYTTTYDVSLSLSTTSANSSTLSTNFAANKGANSTVVFNGPLTVSIKADNTFDLVFPTSSFAYDPNQGNLLLDVVLNQTTTGTQPNGAFLFLTDTSKSTSRVYERGGTGQITSDNSQGLYTQFTVGPPAVPEVSTTVSFGLLLALGLGGLVIAAKRKKAAPSL